MSQEELIAVTRRVFDACVNIAVATEVFTRDGPVDDIGGWVQENFPHPKDFYDGDGSVGDVQKMLVSFMRRSLELIEQKEREAHGIET